MGGEEEDYGDDEDEGPFGVAHDPSQLNIKYQDFDDDDEFEPERFYHQRSPPRYYQRPRLEHHGEDMHHLPSSLVQDLQELLQDYRERFPKQQPRLPSPPPLPPVSEDPPAVPSQPITPAPQPVLDVSFSDEDQEEGELVDNTDPTPDSWEDYVIPMPSPPVPQSSDSPPEDIGGFHNIMQRATSRFHLVMSEDHPDCFLHDFREESRKVSRAIPIIDYVWSEGIKIMTTPASIPPVLPRIEKKYRAPVGSPTCLLAHPKPDSVISQAAQQCSKNPATPISTPPDKEGRRLDLIGKKFSTMAAASIKAANSLAIIGRYDRQMWSDFAEFIDLIPEDRRQEARKILLEGERAASEVIDCALDVANVGFRQLASAAVLRRQGWLRATSFRPEVQTKILDMPYDGESLFGKHIDDALLAIKTDTDTAKSLAALQYKRGAFRGARGRGYPSRGAYHHQQQRQYQPQYRQYSQSSYRKPASETYSRPSGRKRSTFQNRDSGKKQ